MDRPFLRYRYLLAALPLLAALVPAAGCVGALTTIAYLVKGIEIPAEFNGLRGKRVAVVCQPMVALQYRNSTAAKDLARQIGNLLRERVSKVQIVDHRKVDEWIDENTWEDYNQIGKALKADIVLGVELEEFDTLQGQTLYQGRANVTMKVVDCAHGGKVLFLRHLPQILYPPNTGIPTSERQESQFRREFILVLADQIARHFYAHDPGQDFARDTAAL
jgi:hypothetical protein